MTEQELSNNDNVEVEAARARLKEVKHKVTQLTQRLELARRRYSRVARDVAAHKWLSSSSLARAPKDYNRLASTTLRETCGAIAEEFMRVLLELDSVESHGDDHVRDSRRALVRRINGELLPRADALLGRARRMEDLDRDAQHALAQRQAVEEDVDGNDKEPQEGGGSSSSSSNEDEVASPKDEDDKMDVDASPAPAEPPQAPREPKRPRRDPARRPLRYKLGDTPTASTILCELPAGATADDASVSVDRQRGELAIRVQDYPPLVFDVRDPALAPMSATFQQEAPGVLRVSVPKRQLRPQRNMADFVPTRRSVGPRRFGHGGHQDLFTPIWGL